MVEIMDWINDVERFDDDDVERFVYG